MVLKGAEWYGALYYMHVWVFTKNIKVKLTGKQDNHRSKQDPENRSNSGNPYKTALLCLSLDEHEAPDQFYRHEDRREIVGSLMNLQRKIVQLGIKKILMVLHGMFEISAPHHTNKHTGQRPQQKGIADVDNTRMHCGHQAEMTTPIFCLSFKRHLFLF
jgi:hypothetical protein